MLAIDVRTLIDRPWVDEARCREPDVDPDMFFPEVGDYQTRRAARRICNGDEGDPCPVREECLEWALANREDVGVLGGLSARDRIKLRRERNRRIA